MKIRIGYGLGTRSETNDQERFDALIDGLEHHGFDSLWLSERLTSDCPDPLVGMAYACGRTKQLKVGMSVMVLPGRNPVILAKSLASLDRLSAGRVLPAFGLGVANSAEHQAFGVARNERGAWFNEALPLMRRLWAEDHVSHHGKRFTIDDVSVRPKPVKGHLDVWLGGRAPLEMKRVGVHGDGWLPSFCSVADVVAGRREIERIAAEHDRAIEDDHWGVLISYREPSEAIPDRMLALLADRNPDADPNEILPTKQGLPATMQRFIDVGFSKFVLIPSIEPADWEPELAEMAATVLPLEN